MDSLKRIAQLMEERKWTKYKLAKECGMSLSTISNMFKRNTSPTVLTIEAISKAFGITLSQFFYSEEDETTMVPLTEEQKRMFDRWALLTAEQKDLFFKLVENIK